MHLKFLGETLLKSKNHLSKNLIYYISRFCGIFFLPNFMHLLENYFELDHPDYTYSKRQGTSPIHNVSIDLRCLFKKEVLFIM